MKQPVAFALRAILSIVLTTFSLQVWGADCSSTDISLSTQVDVDNFQSTYGGGGVCDVVSGSLSIRSSADITNLNGLSNLTSVAEHLSISENDSLTNLDGLSGLISVGGYLSFYDNTALTIIDGLPSLTSVGGLYIDFNDTLTNLDGLFSLASISGNLEIKGNTALTKFGGLSSLTSISGNLEIKWNSALTIIDGLSSLTSIGGGLGIYDNDTLTNLVGLSSLISVGKTIWINGNTALINLDGLSSLNSVGGDLRIEKNTALTKLGGLSSLTSVGGYLKIHENTSLTNLDGLSGLISVGGYMTIYGNGLTNLNGLSSLTSVGGGLSVSGNPALTIIDGMSSLTSVGGDLRIGCPYNNCDNPALTIIDGLSSLTSIGGSLLIENNPALTIIDGLSSLTSIGGSLFIENNAALTNLNGLSSLTSVGGSLRLGCITYDCYHNNLIDNNNLTNLDGLSSLTSISGDLEIRWNSALTNLNGLSNLNSVGGYLSIATNIALTNLGGLSSLTSVGGSLRIWGNDALTNIDGLSSLTSVGGDLSVFSNDALTNLDGLSSLTSVEGYLSIRENDSLTNLNGLSSLTGVGGKMEIWGSGTLTNISGLSSLTSVGGDLAILGTPLTNLDGLSSLTSVGSLSIFWNTNLTNLDGLSNLTSLEEYLSIQDNDSLTNLDGLSKITSLDGLQIWGNASLTNLDGLSNITIVAWYLLIEANTALTNLDGLSSLTSVGGDLGINSNPVLSRCSALSPLLGWPVGPPYDNVGGSIYLSGNKPGCNSVQEILASVSGLTAPHVTASVVSSGQVTLIFTPAYSSDISWPITGYQAQCLAEDQSIATSETSPVTITGLANNQIYSCSVSAVTGQGTGPASNTVSANFTTDPFTIGGHVSGLSGTGLVLRNNFDDDLEISADGSFTFATALYDGSTYSVTILTASPNQTCSITNSNGTVSGADVVDVMVTCFKTNNELRNIATRAEVRTGNEILIGGFVILGNEPKCVIVQGLGQSVNVPDGVTRLADPVLQLKSGLTTIAENDNWQVQDNPADVQEIEDSGRAPDDILEAAIYKCLNPGAYTALVTGFNNSTGVGMIAIYDADNRTSYLKNIATRSWVGIDHAISIAGFVVTGDTPKQILVRGLGPSMESKFPPNSPLLWDPQLRLYQGATLIETNDDWGDAANAAEIGALPEPLPPTDTKEPAILMTLEPGLYTAHLLGVDGTTGIGNVAVYDLTGRQ